MRYMRGEQASLLTGYQLSVCSLYPVWLTRGCSSTKRRGVSRQQLIALKLLLAFKSQMGLSGITVYFKSHLFTILLKHNCRKALYCFQVYSIMSQHLYALQSDRPISLVSTHHLTEAEPCQIATQHY